MSIFKDKAIVLKIDKVNSNSSGEKIKDKELLYTLFTKTYGKIKANKTYSKNEKNIDIGYVINFEIITSENKKIHKIKNIKINSEFNLNKDKNFSEINNYLETLSLIYREIPEGLSFEEVFEVIEKINTSDNINLTKLILAKLKIKSLLGILNIENKNPIISKILKFIHNSKIDSIFRLTGINEEQKKELENL
ncbi:MAG: hypothetical protein PHV23_01195 [Candidatus Gracilibacteria bacterium]|nr:hypothetical protein [Candidatus Gracilibacteria bacterium]